MSVQRYSEHLRVFQLFDLLQIFFQLDLEAVNEGGGILSHTPAPVACMIAGVELDRLQGVLDLLFPVAFLGQHGNHKTLCATREKRKRSFLIFLLRIKTVDTEESR